MPHILNRLAKFHAELERRRNPQPPPEPPPPPVPVELTNINWLKEEDIYFVPGNHTISAVMRVGGIVTVLTGPKSLGVRGHVALGNAVIVRQNPRTGKLESPDWRAIAVVLNAIENARVEQETTQSKASVA